jgi:sugar lactone lactonase YvrE
MRFARTVLTTIATMAVTATCCFLVACAPPVGNDGTEAPCTSGQVVGCKCASGGTGEKVCATGGKFGACACPDAGPIDAGGGRKPDAIKADDTVGPNKPDAVLIQDVTDDAGVDAGGPIDAAVADTGKPVELTAEVTTVAGTGAIGDDDGPAAETTFQRPVGAVAFQGAVYVADYKGNRIRAIKNGAVTTAAGGVYGLNNAKGAAAQFRHPSGMAVDKNTILIADRDNHAIRRLDPATGAVTAVAGSGSKGLKDGSGGAAAFAGPEGITVADTGVAYVADTQNNRLRRLKQNGLVESITVGGIGFADGPGKVAKFAFPADVAAYKKQVYVADTVNHAIRLFATDSGTTSTLAGNKILGSADGKGKAARFNYPRSVAVNSKGVVFVADTGGHRLRRILPDGTVTTLAGTSAGYTDGPAEAALFSKPWGVAVDAAGALWIADSDNRRIRKYHLVPVEK